LVTSEAAKSTNALRLYRVMAFVTGTVLLIGTIGLVLQKEDPRLQISASTIGPLWVAHGYLFMVYLIATVNLGLRQRWHPVRMALVAAAGTVPTMSFVAERVVTKRVGFGQ
jgi:integral membrane protein